MAATRKGLTEFETIIIWSLLNPFSDDACCAIVISKGLICCTPRGFPGVKPPSEQGIQDMIRASMRFLVKNWSPEELKELRRKLNDCRCDMRNNTIKMLHREIKADMGFEGAFRVVGVVVDMNLSDLKRGHFPKSKNRKVKLWPSDMEDLMQGTKTPGELVGNLFNWVDDADDTTFECTRLFRIFAHLADFSRHFAHEIMISYEWFRKGIDLLGTLLESLKHRPAIDDQYLRYLENLTEYFFTITALATENFGSLDRNFHSSGLKTLRDASISFQESVDSDRILAGINKNRFSNLRIQWGQINKLARESKPEPEKESIRQVTSVPEVPPGTHGVKGNLRGYLFGQLRSLRTADRCMNSRCHQVSGVQDGRTKLCNGCQIIRFCSSKCQKDAWSSMPLPHKTLCDELKAFKNDLITAEFAWKDLFTDVELERDTSWARFKMLYEEKGMGVKESTALLSLHLSQTEHSCMPATILSPGPPQPYFSVEDLRKSYTVGNISNEKEA